MNHSDIRAQMADYLEGDLQLAKRALFDAHLDQCPECSREIGEMRGTIKLLRALPDPEPPPQLVSDVMRRIRLGEAQPLWHQRLLDLLTDALAPRILVPVAAAAGVGFMLISGQTTLPHLPGLESEPAAISVASLPGTSPSESASDASAATRAKTANRSSQAYAASSPGPFRPRDGSATGRFLFRVAKDDLTPIRSEFASEPLTFARRPAIVGPYLGASSALGNDGLRTVATGSGLDGSNAFSQPAARGIGSDSRVTLAKDDRRRLELDSRLTVLVDDPTGFTRWLTALTLAEQELWLKSLANRAVEVSRVSEVERALRESGDVAAASLSEFFLSSADESAASLGSEVASKSESSDGD